MKNTLKILGIATILGIVFTISTPLVYGLGTGPTLSVTLGGTGSTTLTGILIGNTTSAVQTLTIGSGLTLTGTTLSSSASSYTATYPITLSGTAFGIAFGTTTANTWASTQTFTSVANFNSWTNNGNGTTTTLSLTGLTNTSLLATDSIGRIVSASDPLTSLRITNATTTNATTTAFSVSSNHITIGTNSAYLTGTTSPAFNIASTTLDAMGKSFNIGTTTLLMKNWPMAYTLDGFYCVASTTGTAIVNFSHDNGNKTEYSVCTTGSYTRTATNNTFTAFENFNVQASSTAGTVNRITITTVGHYTSD